MILILILVFGLVAFVLRQDCPYRFIFFFQLFSFSGAFVSWFYIIVVIPLLRLEFSSDSFFCLLLFIIFGTPISLIALIFFLILHRCLFSFFYFVIRSSKDLRGDEDFVVRVRFHIVALSEIGRSCSFQFLYRNVYFFYCIVVDCE